jgi:transcriptional regulator GlxA family with amidase domain
VVIVGSGMKTREIANDQNILNQIKLNPQKQIICSQCSGALILSKLSLLENIPVCTDLIHKKFVEESGAIVLDQPFYASGNIASAGGCLSSQYLAFFIISKILDIDNAIKAIYYFAPTGQKDIYVDMAISNVKKYL